MVGSHQTFKIFRQITTFLGNNRALFKFCYRNLHYLIRIIKLQKNQSVKANFMLTTRTTKAEIKEFLINGANETKDKVWNFN